MATCSHAATPTGGRDGMSMHGAGAHSQWAEHERSGRLQTWRKRWASRHVCGALVCNRSKKVGLTAGVQRAGARWERDARLLARSQDLSGPTVRESIERLARGARKREAGWRRASRSLLVGGQPGSVGTV